MTPRQIEILQLAADGYGLRRTAEKLWVEITTVKFHRTNILRELNAKNMAEAVAISIRAGVIE